MKTKGKHNHSLLSEETAAQMLENIFRACKQAPNTVPLHTLTEYSNYRKERFSLQRTVIIIILSLFALLPLLFISTSISITSQTDPESQNPQFIIRPSTVLPVRFMNAKINGATQPVYEDGQGNYIVSPSQNGDMTVTITLINHQTTKKTVSVTGVDYTPPKLTQTFRRGVSVQLYLEDADSGINGIGISVTNEKGDSFPYKYDTFYSTLTINHTNEPLYVDVPDNRGNMLHLLLSPQ